MKTESLEENFSSYKLVTMTDCNARRRYTAKKIIITDYPAQNHLKKREKL